MQKRYYKIKEYFLEYFLNICFKLQLLIDVAFKCLNSFIQCRNWETLLNVGFDFCILLSLLVTQILSSWYQNNATELNVLMDSNSCKDSWWKSENLQANDLTYFLYSLQSIEVVFLSNTFLGFELRVITSYFKILSYLEAWWDCIKM